MLRYRLILSKRAVADIQAAIDYYNSQQSGLGARFYLDFKHQVRAIRLHPFTRAIRYDDVRLALLGKFPYAAHL